MHPLRTWRKNRKMPLEEMSETLGISSVSLSRIERSEQWPAPTIIKRAIEMTDGAVTAADFVEAAVPASVVR